MVDDILKSQLIKQLDHLPADEQQRVLEYAKTLSAQHSAGVPGIVCASQSYDFSVADLDEIERAIEGDCEKIDLEER